MNRYLVLGAILAASFAVVAVETAGGRMLSMSVGTSIYTWTTIVPFCTCPCVLCRRWLGQMN